METCASCHFGRAYPEPGPEPEHQPERKWWDIIPYYPDTDRMFWGQRKYRHEKQVRCCLTPDEREKAKDSFCQHWTAQQ